MQTRKRIADIIPVTKTNWENVGVQPDVSVPADEALEKAKFLALSRTGP
jgi:hypothetical protein